MGHKYKKGEHNIVILIPLYIITWSDCSIVENYVFIKILFVANHRELFFIVCKKCLFFIIHNKMNINESKEKHHFIINRE